MKLLIHIGLPKTGTTFIQSNAFFYKQKLLNEYQIYWPDCCSYLTGEGDTIGHHKLANKIHSSEYAEARQLLDQVYKEAEDKGAKTILLSSEGFSTANPLSFRVILKDLEFDDIKFIAYLRSPLELMLSWYAQDVHGQCVFTNFMTWHSMRKEYVSNSAIIKKWLQVWPNSVDLRLYDRNILENGDIWQDFQKEVLEIGALIVANNSLPSNLSLKGNLFIIKKILNEFTFLYRSFLRKTQLISVQRAQTDEESVYWHLFNELAGEKRFLGRGGYPLASYEVEYLLMAHRSDFAALDSFGIIKNEILSCIAESEKRVNDFIFSVDNGSLIADVAWIRNFVQELNIESDYYPHRIIASNREELLSFISKIC